MRVVHSPRHVGHAPEREIEHGRPVPTRECPERVELVLRALRADGGFTEQGPNAFGVGPIEAVHDPGLVRFLERAWGELSPTLGPEVVGETFLHPAVRAGMGPLAERADMTAMAELALRCWETNTPLVEGTYDAARSAVDVALTATEVVLAGEPMAYGLCRPPGHHAPRAAYGGFCFFNNAAIAAHHVVATTGARVTVLDVDYHHGNGTQQIFYERDDVQYVSLHGDPRRAYPYVAGFEDETGTGVGAGSTLNLPLPAGLADDDYLMALDQATAAIDRFAPGLLVVSLGVDTYHRDPISDLGLTQDGFAACGQAVAALGLPTVVLQEGGYDLESIGENVRRWLAGFRSLRSAGGATPTPPR